MVGMSPSFCPETRKSQFFVILGNHSEQFCNSRPSKGGRVFRLRLLWLLGGEWQQRSIVGVLRFSRDTVPGYPKEEGLLDYLGCPWGPEWVSSNSAVGSVTPGAFLEALLDLPSSQWDGVGRAASNGGYVARFWYRNGKIEIFAYFGFFIFTDS